MSPDIYLKSFLSKKFITFFFILLELPVIILNGGSKKLINEYNNCLEEIRTFRDLHLEFAGIYINKQSQIKNPFGGGSTITGTGGTPFMKYLKKHRDETEKQKI